MIVNYKVRFDTIFDSKALLYFSLNNQALDVVSIGKTIGSSDKGLRIKEKWMSCCTGILVSEEQKRKDRLRLASILCELSEEKATELLDRIARPVDPVPSKVDR